MLPRARQSPFDSFVLQQPPTFYELRSAGSQAPLAATCAPCAPQTRVTLTGGGGGGAPCVICYGEDGALRTLHCGYRVHAECLKRFWSEKAVVLGRTANVHCPADVAGCNAVLSDEDLRGIIGAADVAEAERSICELDAQNRRSICELDAQN